jgi:hypothetical protein
MSTNNGVTPSSYDLIILESKNIKRFFQDRESKTDARTLMVSPPYISLEKEGQVYYSNSI